jgi:hypothetical protein
MKPNNDTITKGRTLSNLCRALERTDPLSVDSQKVDTVPETGDDKPESSADERKASKQRAVESWENEGGEVPSVPVSVVEEPPPGK